MFCNINLSQIVITRSGILSNTSPSIASCYTMESHIEVDEQELHILYVNLHIVVDLEKKMYRESQCFYAN